MAQRSVEKAMPAGSAGLLPGALAVIAACGGIYAGIVHAAKLAANKIVQEYSPTTSDTDVGGLLATLFQERDTLKQRTAQSSKT